MLNHLLYLYSLRNASLQGCSGEESFDNELWKGNANIVCVAQQRFNPDTQEVAVAKVDKKGKGKARQV